MSVRLKLSAAANEFKIERHTLAARLTAASIKPDEDDKYTIPQLCQAVYGDYEIEKTRESKERADKLALENGVSRKELIPACDVIRVWSFIITAFRDRVLAAQLSTELRDELLGILESPTVNDYFTSKQAIPADLEPAAEAD